jgi:UDP-glucose 4-epimerase
MTSTTFLNSRVLITGGAGLVGSHIADQSVDLGVVEIIVFDNFVRGRNENLAYAKLRGKVSVIEGDLRDAKLLGKTMQGADIVFHQAAIRITQCAEEPRLALVMSSRRTRQSFLTISGFLQSGSLQKGL